MRIAQRPLGGSRAILSVMSESVYGGVLPVSFSNSCTWLSGTHTPGKPGPSRQICRHQ